MKATQLPIIVNNATTGHKLQGSGVDTLFVHNWSYVTNCLTLFSHGLKLDQDFSAENHLAMIYNSILYHYRSHECCKISQLFLLAIGVKRNMMNYLVTTFAFHDLFMTTLHLPMAAFQSSHLPVVTIPQESSHLVPLSMAPAKSSHMLAVTLPIIPRGASLGRFDRIQRIVRLPHQLPHFMASSSPTSL